MNIQVMDRVTTGQKINLAIADCDIHPTPKSVPVEIYPYLSKRWQDYMETYGIIYRQGFPTGPAFPKGQPNAARRDAYPPGGGSLAVIWTLCAVSISMLTMFNWEY